MDWRRRQLLTAVGASGVATLAGCGGLLTEECVSQQVKLVAQDGDEDDWFGWSVALAEDGSIALIGAVSARANAGAAYVFSRSEDSWSQQTRLGPDDGDLLDGFGTAVALGGGGSTALVGAELNDDPNGEHAGSAYVFEGPWEQ